MNGELDLIAEQYIRTSGSTVSYGWLLGFSVLRPSEGGNTVLDVPLGSSELGSRLQVEKKLENSADVIKRLLEHFHSTYSNVQEMLSDLSVHIKDDRIESYDHLLEPVAA